MSEDLISKEKAYEVLTEYYHHKTEMQHKALKEALDRVPSAEPKLATNLQLTCNQLATDCISRQAAIDAILEMNTENRVSWLDCALDTLDALPSAEPERKKGRWIDMGDFEQCSACGGTRLKEVNTVYGKAIWIKTPYCYNCGAEMEKGEDDDTD